MTSSFKFQVSSFLAPKLYFSSFLKLNLGTHLGVLSRFGRLKIPSMSRDGVETAAARSCPLSSFRFPVSSFILLFPLLFFLAFHSMAQDAPQLQTMDLTVDGIPRTALVYVPPDSGSSGKPLPLVFVFHGHGGHAKDAVGGFRINQLWPEAISVYPQGINTPGLLHDPEGKLPGWQSMPGTLGDRDLHFFDAMLAQLEKDHRVDPARIYCTGHSNGAIFTYLLWLSRPDVIAAVAPCSGFAPYGSKLRPKPAMILGGSNDQNVKFEWQQNMIDAVIKLNGCNPAGTPWEGAGTLYPSSTGTPLVTFVYPGGHPMVPAEPPLIVKFFQQHPAATETRNQEH